MSTPQVLKELQMEMTSLEDRREMVRIQVKEAAARGEDVEKYVSDWRRDVERLKRDVDHFMEQSTAKENMLWFARSCPNIKWRYQMSKQVKQKIADVKRRLTEGSHFVFRLNENFVNFDSRILIFNDIVVALKDLNINMIGVHGIGGVGKTTLVEEIGNKMRHDGDFKQVLLATVSNNPNVKEIQSKLADSLNFELCDRVDEKGRADQLWHKLTNGEKYLVILDDVGKKLDMKAIGIPITAGKTRCKVLLTSQNEDLLRNIMKVDRNFSIVKLRDPEAWALFNEKVENSIKSHSDLYPLAYEMCKKCEGLPVAINALGAALKGKPEYAWKNALENLEAWKNALDNLEHYTLTKIEDIGRSVWASLRVSYDMLHSSDAQSCFLLCCLFAKDAEISIDDLTRHCMARSLLHLNPQTFDEATNAVRTLVDTLKSCFLLLNGSNENIVKIHDVIRDVGIWIENQKEACVVDHGALIHWPSNSIDGPQYSSISLRSSKIKRLPDGLVYSQLHTLILDNDKLSDLEVQDKFFNGMEKLTVLILTRLRMGRLPSSLGNLTLLRMLYLNECELEDIAILRDLKTNLEVLSLRGSDIKALPQEMAQLTSLRVLDLQDCYYLKVIPQGVIAHLTSLEELYLPEAFGKWKATIDEKQDKSNRRNMSLAELRYWSLNTHQLTTLHIHIRYVMLLPNEGLMFESLKRFNITIGVNYEESRNYHYEVMYDSFKKYSATLKLHGFTFTNELIPLVDKAEVLILKGIEALEKALPSMRFNELTTLFISDCKIKYLFSEFTARQLIHLKQLSVSSCLIMEEIVRFEGQYRRKVEFSKLKKLKLYDLPNLISLCAKKEKMETTMESSSIRAQHLFNEKVIFPALEKLDVCQLGNIAEIWDKQSLLVHENAKLVVVKVDKCVKLMNLIPSNLLKRLHNLQVLEVETCPNIESIIYENGKEEEEKAANDSTLVIFPRLRTLTIRNMENLKSFYSSSKRSNAQSLFNHQVIFPILKELEVNGLSNIVEIWDKQSPLVHRYTESFSQLVVVKVYNCAKLMNFIPSNILPRLLQNLQELYVSECQNMESVIFENGTKEEAASDSTFVTIPQLRTLKIQNMENLKNFYSTAKRFHARRSLFNHQVILPILKELNVYGLGKIVEIWDTQSPLVHEKAESFSQLEDVRVKDCAELRNLVPFHILPRLHNLEIKSCSNIEFIIYENRKEEEEKASDDSTLVIIPQLRTLQIEDMKKLKSFCTISETSNAQCLFNHQVIFPVLKKLDIHGLGNIVEIWDMQSPLVHEKAKSFSQLEDVRVEDCAELRNLVPSHILPQLHNLEVKSCSKIESIIYENGKEEEEEEKAADDSTLVIIPQLRTLQIKDMKRLKSFCTSSETSNAQCLFNHQVHFSVLKKLDVDGLSNIVEIWDTQSPLLHENAESFSQLVELRVGNCVKLMNLVPSNILLSLLQNLQELFVCYCQNMESIVFENGNEEEAAADDSTLVIIPHLRTLTLQRMENLKSFYSSSKRSNTQSLFNHQVIFPVLKKLDAHGLGNIVEIWDMQSPLVYERAESFSQLEDVRVEDCAKLMNLVPSNILPRLHNLQVLEVETCPNIESIVYENEKEEEEKAVDDSTLVIIPQLRTLTIRNMENLKSFYSSFERSNAQSLFNHQVAFPSVEELFILCVPNATEIWDKQPLPQTESFQRLKHFTVWGCAQLVYIFPSYMLPRLQNLQKLEITDCKEVKVVVSLDLEEKKAATNHVIVFPRLENVALKGLNKLTSFCSTKKVFFSNKVIFPVLKKIDVHGLRDIYHQFLLFHDNTTSFSQLEDVRVEKCAKLMNLVPSYMLGRLKNMQVLEVETCPKIESIVFENGKEIEAKAADDITLVIISQLRTLTIQNMENLKSFYSSSKRSNAQSLFNHQVIFPVLEQLDIRGLCNIVDIWDKQSVLGHENAESFSKLEYVRVEDFAKLINLLPSNILPWLQNLQELNVCSCPNLESIVFENRKEEEAADDSTSMIIPQLSTLGIGEMEKLKSFYSSSKRSNAQSLFNHPDIFPALETLSIWKVPNIIEIWDKQPLSKPKKETKSVCKLQWVDVDNCEQLVYVFPSYMLPQLHILQSLEIRNCKQLEMIVSTELEEKEAANNDVIVFPQLHNVELADLNKLKSFCSGTQVFFSNKDAFPVLEEIELDEDLEFFRNGTSTKKEAIEECGTSGKENDHNGEEG